MTIPEFHNTVRGVVPITVVANVKIGSNGRAEGLRLKPSNDFLKFELQRYLVDETRYREKCAGKTISLIFTYRLEGNESKYPVNVTRFEPPNHFIVTSEPLTPIGDPAKRVK
jgi:hypothetical protein